MGTPAYQRRPQRRIDGNTEITGRFLDGDGFDISAGARLDLGYAFFARQTPFELQRI